MTVKDAGDAKASASASPSSGGGGGDGGNAEDYMTALCFVLLRAGASPNCASFLSNLQFVACALISWPTLAGPRCACSDPAFCTDAQRCSTTR